MHHALEIREILSIIFSHCTPLDLLSAYRDEDDSASDLLALARTCRVFKDPALDLLWRDLDDLSPLVRCLPEAFHTVSGRYCNTVVRWLPVLPHALFMNILSFFLLFCKGVCCYKTSYSD